MFCFSCGKEIQKNDRVGRRDQCPSCHHDLHACKNCEFYDPSAYNECREPQAERVLDKEASNFCDYFNPSSRKVGLQTNQIDEAKKKLEKLFTKKRET